MELKLKDCATWWPWPTTGTSAARRRAGFVSQPTLSAQAEEARAGARGAAHRAGAQQRLPHRGREEIVARARRILEASDEVVTLARSQRDPLAGKLRVAALADHRSVPAARVAPRDPQEPAAPASCRLYEYQTAPMLEKLHGGRASTQKLRIARPRCTSPLAQG